MKANFHSLSSLFLPILSHQQNKKYKQGLIKSASTGKWQKRENSTFTLGQTHKKQKNTRINKKKNLLKAVNENSHHSHYTVRWPTDCLLKAWGWTPASCSLVEKQVGEWAGVYSMTWIKGMWSSLHLGGPFPQRAGVSPVVNASSFRQSHGYIDEDHLIGAGRP